MQVVEIHKNDIVTQSPTSVVSNAFGSSIAGSTYDARSAGRRFDEWYEGY